MSPRAWSLFTAVSLVWGVPYLFIKIAVNGGMPPLVLAWGRIMLAAAILLALAWHAGVMGQLRGRARGLIAYAVIELCIPFPLIATGERHVASSLAAIIIASVPLLVALLAIRLDQDERTTGPRLVGLVVGLVGVVLLVGVDASGSLRSLLGAGAVLIAAVGYAGGPLILKRSLGGLDPRATMGACLAIAGLILTPFAALDAPEHLPSGGAVASTVVLGVVCTALAFFLMALLIAEVGPARAVVVTYVNPVVAVVLGVALLGERPGAGAIAGLLLILAGSWLATGGRPPSGVRRLSRTRSAAAGPSAVSAGPD